MKPHIRIALVDDSYADRKTFEAYMKHWLENASITYYSEPPEDLRELLQYDLIVLDQMLKGGIAGTDLAQLIGDADPGVAWLTPIVILTASQPGEFKDQLHLANGLFSERGALHYVDYMAWKFPERSGVHFSYGQHGVIAASVRWIGRMKAYEQKGYRRALEDVAAGKVAGYFATPTTG